MTDSTFIKPSLGVGSIVGETFSLFFRQFVPIVLAVYVPILLMTLLSMSLFGASMALGESPATPEDIANFSFWSLGGAILLQMVVGSLCTAIVIQIAYDTKVGRPVRIGASISNAISVIVPIIVLSLVVGVAAGVASLALLVPGLYLYAMWAVLVPAIVVERAGFGALGRSAALTKDYRWPVLGTILLVGICVALVSFGLQLFIGMVLSSAVGVAGVLLTTITSAVVTGFVSVAIALIYARLREIKEGVSIDSLVEVFA